jgi:hypothetical protein
MDQTIIPYKPGMDYGMGVKTSSAAPMALGVAGAPAAIPEAAGGEAVFHLSRIQTTEELENHLNISADASGGIGMFSASARFDFARDCKVQTSSLVLLIYATETLAWKQINDPVLSSIADAAQHDLDAFAARFGDAFVRGMWTGGQFFGVIRIDTRSEESRQNIEMALGGSYGVFSGEAHTKLVDAAKKETASIYVDAYWEGGLVTTLPTTPDNMLAAMDEWEKTVSTKPVPYFVSLVPYVIAGGPQPADEADLEHQLDVLKRCAKLRSQTLDKLNLVDYIRDPSHASEFQVNSGGPDLAQLSQALSEDLELIAAAASNALNHPRTAVDPETFAKVNQGKPNYRLTMIPPNMPSHGGDTVKVPDFATAADKSDADQIAAKLRITIHWSDSGTAGSFKVLSQDPTPGIPVRPGAIVNVVMPAPLPAPTYWCRIGEGREQVPSKLPGFDNPFYIGLNIGQCRQECEARGKDNHNFKISRFVNGPWGPMNGDSPSQIP